MTRPGGPNGHVLEQLDLYLDRELSGSIRADIEAHLDECAECAGELRIRTSMRNRLRAAVKSVPVSPALERRVRQTVGERWRGIVWSWPRTMLVMAATVLVCVGVFIAYRPRDAKVSQAAYIGSLSRRVGAIMRVGLGDHIHCTVFRKFPAKAPTAEQMSLSLGLEYRDLLAIMKDHVPPDYRVVMAHKCRYNGRQFVHLTATNGAHLMSLVISRKAEGESFSGEQLPPLLLQSGIALYRAGVERFDIAGFETPGHLVYLVSDSGGRTNAEVITALATGVRDTLRKIESAT